MAEASGEHSGPDGGELAAERVGRNDATFRAANEQIRDAAGTYEMAQNVPFLCECAEPACREIIALSLADYERIRRNSRHFLNAPGHQRNAGRHGRVVDGTDRYVVVEKVGRAGEIVEELDPRSRSDDRLERAQQ